MLTEIIFADKKMILFTSITWIVLEKKKNLVIVKWMIITLSVLMIKTLLLNVQEKMVILRELLKKRAIIQLFLYLNLENYLYPLLLILNVKHLVMNHNLEEIQDLCFQLNVLQDVQMKKLISMERESILLIQVCVKLLYMQEFYKILEVQLN